MTIKGPEEHSPNPNQLLAQLAFFHAKNNEFENSFQQETINHL